MQDLLKNKISPQPGGQGSPQVNGRAPFRSIDSASGSASRPSPGEELTRILQSLDIDTHAIPLDLYKNILFRDPVLLFEEDSVFRHRPILSHERGNLCYAYVSSLCRELRGTQLHETLSTLFHDAQGNEAQALLLDALLESGSYDADSVVHHCIREGLIHQEALDRVYARQRSRSPAILRRLETYRYTAGVYAELSPHNFESSTYSGLQRSALDVSTSIERLLFKLREDSRSLTPFQSDPLRLRTLEHTLYDLQMLTERRDARDLLRSEQGLECIDVLLGAARNFTYESVPDCLRRSLQFVVSSGAPISEVSSEEFSFKKDPVERLLASACLQDRDITVLQRLLGGRHGTVSHLATSMLALTSGSREMMLSLLQVTKDVLSTTHGYEGVCEQLIHDYTSLDHFQNEMQIESLFDCVGIEDSRAPLAERLARFVSLLKYSDQHPWKEFASAVFSEELDFSYEQRSYLLATRDWTPEMKLYLLEQNPNSLVRFLHEDSFFRSLHEDALLQVEQHLSAALLRSGEQMPLSDIMRTLAVIARGSPLESRRLFHRLLEDSGFQIALKESLSVEGKQSYEGPRPILAVLYASLVQEGASVMPTFNEAAPEETPVIRMSSLPRLIVFLDRAGEDPKVQGLVAAAEELCYRLYQNEGKDVDSAYHKLLSLMTTWDDDPTYEAICSLHDKALIQEIRTLLDLYQEGEPDRRFLRMLSKGIVRLSDGQDPALRGQQFMFLSAVQHFLPAERQHNARIHRNAIRDTDAYASSISERILALLPKEVASTPVTFSSLFARAFGFLQPKDTTEESDSQEDTPHDSEHSDDESEVDGSQEDMADADEDVSEDTDPMAAHDDVELHPWSSAESTEVPFEERGRHTQDTIAEIVPPLVGSERYLLEAVFSQYNKSKVQYSALGQGPHEEDAAVRAFLRDTYLHMQEQETREVQIQYSDLQDRDSLPLPMGSVLVPPVGMIEGRKPVRLQVNNDLGYRFQSPDTSAHRLTVETTVCTPRDMGHNYDREAVQQQLGAEVYHSLTRAAVSLEEFPEAFQEAIREAREMQSVSQASDHIVAWIQNHYRYDKSALQHPDYQSQIKDGPYPEDDPDHYLAAIHTGARDAYDGATICGGFTHVAVQALRLAGIPVLYGRGFYVSDSGSESQKLQSEDKHAFPVLIALDAEGVPFCMPREVTPENAGFGLSLSMNLSLSELSENRGDSAEPSVVRSSEEVRYVTYFQSMLEEMFPDAELPSDQRDKLMLLFTVLDRLRQKRSMMVQDVVQSCAAVQHEKRDPHEAFISSWQRLVNPFGLSLLNAVADARILEELGIERALFEVFLKYAEEEWERLERHFAQFEFDPSIFDLPKEGREQEGR